MAGNSSFSGYTENKILDHLIGKTSFVMPTVYIGLSTADPDEDASGLAEPSGNGYARVTTSGGTWSAASGGITSNVSAIDFPSATGSWGAVTHFVLFDALTNGNMLAYGELTAPETITSGKIVRFSIGQLTISLD